MSTRQGLQKGPLGSGAGLRLLSDKVPSHRKPLANPATQLHSNQPNCLETVSTRVSWGTRGGWGREERTILNGDFFFPFAYGGTDGPMIHKNCLQLNSHFAWSTVSCENLDGWGLSAGREGARGQVGPILAPESQRPEDLVWARSPSKWGQWEMPQQHLSGHARLLLAGQHKLG